MPPDLLMTVGGTFVAVALLAGLLAQRLLVAASPERRRLRGLTEARPTGVVREDVSLADTPNPFWSRIARAVPRSPKDMSHLQRRITMAGYTGAAPAVLYALAEFVAPVVFGVTTMFLLPPANLTGWGFIALAAVIGFFLPGLFLERKINLRRKQIRNGLPDVLDLLVVCLEAGSSLDQAVLKASDDLEIAYPALAAELRILNMETRAGKARLEAFRNLADRTKLEDVRALVAMLVQTDRFGTSVSQALRTFGKALRTKRRQLAEERAAKVGVKLVFPLVLCLFPAFYVVTLGPAIIQFIRVFFGQMVAGR